mmetsp:Transcript_60362/g.143849  ORF Transcript_60362/g.143849 Transcript_60362/m.143849 type:complete len:326 (+) Transcript_60362:66-1043(+)
MAQLPMASSFLFLLLATFSLVRTAALQAAHYHQDQLQKYLLVSSAIKSEVAYLKLTNNLPNAREGMRMLVDTGLEKPQGLAVDDFRGYLYVADPGLHSLVRFRLHMDGDALRAGKRENLIDGVEVRWVAVDGLGNVFFSDEENHQIVKIPIELLEGKTSSENATATVLYDGSRSNKVSAPGGVAVDNYHIYWVNKFDGAELGTLMSGSEMGLSAPRGNISTLTANAQKCYGVCTLKGNIFFTDEVHNLYGYSRRTGKVSTVTKSLLEGRGCASDGVGTVFVADKTANAVLRLPGTDPAMISSKSVRKAVDFEGAYGVAVYTTALI